VIEKYIQIGEMMKNGELSKIKTAVCNVLEVNSL
jgi:hypothetical protein